MWPESARSEGDRDPREVEPDQRRSSRPARATAASRRPARQTPATTPSDGADERGGDARQVARSCSAGGVRLRSRHGRRTRAGGHGAARIIAAMHPNALLEAQTELVHRVLRFEHPADRVVADFFREQRALGARERHRSPTASSRCCASCRCWRHLASSAQRRPRRDRAAPGAARLAGQRRRPARRARRARARVAGALPRLRPRRACPSALRHNLPDWLAEPLQARARRRVLALGRGDRRAGAARPARQRAQGRSRRGPRARCAAPASTPRRRRIRRSASASTASRRCRRLDVFDAGPGRGAGRRQPAARAAHRRAGAARWWSTSAPAPAARRSRSARRCATPGRLYAFDVSGHRLAALKPRLARSGLSNVYPAQIAHERDDRIKRLAGKIDRVLVDAPCTRLGHAAPQSRPEVAPVARGARRAGAEQQRAILAAAARLVKPGGRLVYATCSAARRRRRGGGARVRRRRTRRDFSRAAGRSTLLRARPGRRRRDARQRRRTCVSGRIGTQPMASSPRSGSAA